MNLYYLTYWKTRFSKKLTFELQQKLQFFNLYKMRLDGKYGPGTHAAVEKFQKMVKCYPLDGKAGKGTWAALNKKFYAEFKGYIYLRRFGCDVHLLLTDHIPTMFDHKGTKKRTVSRAALDHPEFNAIMSGGYFGHDSNHYNGRDFLDYILVDGVSKVVDLSKELIPNHRIIFNFSYGICIDGVYPNLNDFIDRKKFKFDVKAFGHYRYKHPRMMMGDNKARYILVGVDGRSSKSAGMSIKQQIQLAQELYANNLGNGDGGGTVTVEVDGKIVNKPSDGHERKIGSKLGVRF